jgi:hypothetical protein
MAKRSGLRPALLIAAALGAVLATAASAPNGQDVAAFEKACADKGGVTRRDGEAQALYCIRPAPDAGKACSRKSDCTGQCLFDPTSRSAKALDNFCRKACRADAGCTDRCMHDPRSLGGRPLVGRCQADDGPMFGCYDLVDNGRRESICVD